MRRIETASANPEELRLTLKRTAIDEVQVSEAVARRTAEVFGKPLSPLEAVKQIIADVEAHGDAAVVEYTEKLDGVKLAPEQFFVDDEEIAAARGAWAKRSWPRSGQRAVGSAVFMKRKGSVRGLSMDPKARSWANGCFPWSGSAATCRREGRL